MEGFLSGISGVRLGSVASKFVGRELEDCVGSFCLCGPVAVLVALGCVMMPLYAWFDSGYMHCRIWQLTVRYLRCLRNTGIFGFSGRRLRAPCLRQSPCFRCVLGSTADTCTAVSGSFLFGACVDWEIQAFFLDFLESTLYHLYPAVFGVSIWSDSGYAFSWQVLASIEKQRNLDFSGNDVRCAAWFSIVFSRLLNERFSAVVCPGRNI